MSKKDVYQYSDDEFIKSVKSSNNIKQALQKLGLKPSGANYNVFRRRCQQLQLEVATYDKRKNNYKKIRETICPHTVEKAVADSVSCRSCLSKLSLGNVNSNRSWLLSVIDEQKFSTSHWRGQGHLKGKTHNWSRKKPLKEILTKNSSYTNNSCLKSRLMKELGWKNICSSCGISTWHGQSLSLHLDHINGVNNDNRLKNLRLLCPNCHSLTETYCGKNKAKH